MAVLDSTATPVGMLEDSEYPVSETRLAPGSKILIHSDGISEARNQAGEYFSERRVRECLRLNAQRRCNEILDALSQEVAGFSAGAVQSDDMTILVVEYQKP